MSSCFDSPHGALPIAVIISVPTIVTLIPASATITVVVTIAVIPVGPALVPAASVVPATSVVHAVKRLLLPHVLAGGGIMSPLRGRVIHSDVSAVQVVAVQVIDSIGSVLVLAHGDETEASRPVSLG